MCGVILSELICRTVRIANARLLLLHCFTSVRRILAAPPCGLVVTTLVMSSCTETGDGIVSATGAHLVDELELLSATN